MATETLERADVQGLVLRGYGQLRGARYLLCQIADGAAARGWLADLSVAAGGPATGDVAVNVAFTASGLARLGVSATALAQFSRELLDGMTTEHRRRILGDVDGSAPERWSWGAPAGERIDMLALVFGRDDAAAAAVPAVQERALAAGGIRLVHTLETVPLEDREHFGFRDGISQPRFPRLGEASGIPERDVVATGELVLGYRNAYGRYTPRPVLAPAEDPGGVLPADPEGSGGRDLGRNGTYLVLRQLAQDVEGFWEFCRRADPADPLRLAARMIGRWPSGTPLVLEPDADRTVRDLNDFAYHAADPHGVRCPIGAHVRRANPRDTLDPAPGTSRSVDVNKRHRLLRRGRKYGTAPGERGLHFICLVANIARQFEFVQHSWLNDPRFNGLYDQPDPLVAPTPPNGRTFSVATSSVRERHTGVPRFVSVRGGAYFFLPGIRALRYLAARGGAP